MKIIPVSVQETLPLRRKALRPGRSLQDCIFDGDNDSETRHYAVVDDDGNIVGIASVYQRNNQALDEGQGYQLRAMAVDTSCRGMGLGNLLLDAVEQYAKSQGAGHVWANARTDALGFYQRAGYSVMSDEFMIEQVGPHFLVCKSMA